MKNNENYNEEFENENLSGKLKENEPESVDKNLKTKISKKTVALLTAGAILLGGAGAAGYVFGLDPYFKTKAAEKELSEMFANRAPIQAENTNVFEFNIEYSEEIGEIAKQKALGSDNAPSMATFSFTNGKPLASNETKTLETYLDFNSQRSRDFFNQNADSLKSLVETGKIKLNIVPVPSDNPYSAYAPEALAVVFEKYPDKAWDSLKQLMKLSVVIADEGVTGKNEIIERIVKSVNSTGASITSKEILKGEYASWVLSVATSEKLKTSGGVPALYLNGDLVNTDEVDILNSESLVSYIWKK